MNRLHWRLLGFYCLVLTNARAFSGKILAVDHPVSKGAHEARTDREGEALPAAALQRLGSRHFRVQAQSLAFSPDGRTLASGGDGSIRFWHIPTGKELPKDIGFRESINCLIYSPNGQLLASGGDRFLRIWDPATGKMVHDLEPRLIGINSVAISPDGRTLAAGGRDQIVELWDVKTGKKLRPLEGHKDSIQSVNFSPDGKTLASAGKDRTVIVWRLATRKPLYQFRGHRDTITCVAFSPSGRMLASGSHHTSSKCGPIAPMGLPSRGMESSLPRPTSVWCVCGMCKRAKKSTALRDTVEVFVASPIPLTAGYWPLEAIAALFGSGKWPPGKNFGGSAANYMVLSL
jgi:WD40 repeat protein